MLTFKEEMERSCTVNAQQILGLNRMNPLDNAENYFKNQTVGLTSIDPNANVGQISPNSFMAEMAKPFLKLYFYKRLYEAGQKIYGEWFSLKHIFNGDVYLHDATKIQPYCVGVSALDILTEGRPYSIPIAKPAKRLESYMGQLTEYMMDCSQEWAGAVAVTDLVPCMAWFVEKGKGRLGLEIIPYIDKEIENVFQSFVHVLNNKFRVGGDSPFTNISVNSKDVYDDIFNHYTFPDGKTVQDMWKTIDKIQRIIVNFMEKGQSNGLPYRFPILTANFKSNGREQNTEWFKWIAEKNAKGFMNVNFAERFAMCCRLNLEFDFKQNSFGGGGVKLGSMRVANVNLPRMAYLVSKEKPADIELAFYSNISNTIDHAIEYLVSYSQVFNELVKIGYLKFFREPSAWFTTSMFFATVGFCGIYDAAEMIAKKTGSDVFQIEEKVIDIFLAKTREKSNGIKFNVEEVPSESAAGTMAKFNRDFGEKKIYYSNQFVPLNLDIPLNKRIEIEARLQSRLTGGGMTFLNFDAPLSPEQSLSLHKKLMDMRFHGQFCINYGFTQCLDCEKVQYGIHDKCECESKNVLNISRVVGYYAVAQHAAKSKYSEIMERRVYSSI